MKGVFYFSVQFYEETEFALYMHEQKRLHSIGTTSTSYFAGQS